MFIYSKCLYGCYKLPKMKRYIVYLHLHTFVFEWAQLRNLHVLINLATGTIRGLFAHYGKE